MTDLTWDERIALMRSIAPSAYLKQRAIQGDNFESRMAEVCAEIMLLASQSKSGSYDDATLAVLVCDSGSEDPEDKEADRNTHEEIIAALIWRNLESDEMEKALKELG